MTGYVTRDGRTLFVSDAFSDGRWWGTFFKKASGSLARFKTASLPMRTSKRDAETDLERYAEANGLRKVAIEEVASWNRLGYS
jgi:hypothetical protein